MDLLGMSNEGFDMDSYGAVMNHDTVDTDRGKFSAHTASRKIPALVVREAYKQYSKEDGMILNNFNMTVQQGTIYSLLGSSGCGKTTILSCCVSLLKLNRGSILTYGSISGSRESGIPGKNVGYMPQELSLYEDFTIKECIQYFARIYGMSKDKTEERLTFLVRLLVLPTCDSIIKNLSGGQKRRVSFAAALIHNPRLLILDEPTVGVDPLLREKIWTHLRQLVSQNDTTVVITTHYHEEAGQSDTIGLMRNGRLLVEKSPSKLFNSYSGLRLEEIVLQLCKQDAIRDKTESLARELEPYIPVYADGTEPVVGLRYKRRKSSVYNVQYAVDPDFNEIYLLEDIISIGHRITALVTKNVILMLRNLIFFAFVFLVPALHILFICFGIGNDPKYLKFGVINHEVPNSEICHGLQGCIFENLSCRYLDTIPPDTFTLVPFRNEEDAMAEIEKGNIWGFMEFPHNYTAYFVDREVDGNFVTKDSINQSRIRLRLDSSSSQVALTMGKVFFQSHQRYVSGLLSECGESTEVREIPIYVETPIYGSEETNFREYIAPSLMLGFLFFFPLCSSGMTYINEKKMGTVNRSLVAGVTTPEVMVAYLISQFLVLLGQAASCLVLLIVVFKIGVTTNIVWGIVLCILTGFGGVSMGFLVATFCTEALEAVLLAIGFFFPNFLLSGMVWPVEGMPVVLQYFSYLLPCRFACQSFRAIISKGWGITHPVVWRGFVSTLAWITFYWTLTIIIHRHRAVKG